MLFYFIAALVTCTIEIAQAAQTKYVFAHYLVGNANGNSIAEWTDDITLAIDAHIDGFALNVAATDTSNAASLSNAFQAANQLANTTKLGDFKMFFSFDYAAQGAWPAANVIDLIKEYGTNYAYFQYNNQPFVSTFEGPDSASDWVSIKQQTGCFFIPDWSSIGPVRASAKGVADGLFSWDAWPNGAMDKSTASDLAYLAVLDPLKQPYMMGVSPWFYTNLPEFNKNWIWRGDDLWYDRWEQVIQIAPEFVEIITWNDYGESHYIGPIQANDLGLFDNSPFNYVKGYPHDGWRAFLPYSIDSYKAGAPVAVTFEQVVSWYRLMPNTACGTGGTVGNNANQSQVEVPPSTLDLDAVYFSALLDSDASFDVTIGTTTQTGTWRNTPVGGSGIYHGSMPFNGATGQVTVTIWRMINGQKTTIVEIAGASIALTCTVENWNAWVGVSNATTVSGGPPPPSSTTSTITTWTTPTTTGTTTSTTTPTTTPTGTPTTPELAPTCAHDNCLRQFLRNTAVTSFCATYTAAINTATTDLPWYVVKCNMLPSRISSACSCVVTPTPT